MSAPTTQKQYRLVKSAGQGFDLQITEAPVRAPEADEALVKVHAASLNRRDWYVIKGFYPVGGRDSLIPLSDAAGEVVAVGSRVTRLRAGNRVAANFYERWVDGRLTVQGLQSAFGAQHDGLLSQYITVKESCLALLPASLSFEEGASLPCAGVTAWSGLFTRGDLKVGDFVLIQGTGGVSIFGLQIAAAAGAKPIVISSSDEKLARARSLGAHAVINYVKTPEWDKAIRDLTGGVGVNQVLEVGGKDTIVRSLASLAVSGHIALIGGLTAFGGDIPVLGLLGRDARASGIAVGSRTDFDALNAFLDKHHIAPVIDRVFEFNEVPAAYEHMGSNNFFGKLIIRL